MKLSPLLSTTMERLWQLVAGTKQFGFGKETKTMTILVKQFFQDILKMLSLLNGLPTRISFTAAAMTIRLSAGDTRRAWMIGSVVRLCRVTLQVCGSLTLVRAASS